MSANFQSLALVALFTLVGGCGTEIPEDTATNDADRDGFPANVDCNDEDPTIHPEADEVCDGVDNNCDSKIDINASDLLTWYVDSDGDGYGNVNRTETSCSAPNGMVAEGTDCDDDDVTTYPGAPELCDNLDNDCDGQPEQQNELVEVWPDSGSTDANYRTDIRAMFTVTDADVTVEAGGVPVGGTTTWRDDVLVFTPDAYLEPNTTYEATWDYDCGPTVTDFTTNELGAPADLTALPGKVYLLDIANADWVKPTGVGSLLGSYMTTVWLLEVTSATSTELAFMSAVADELSPSLAQHECSATGAITTDFTANPYFQSASADYAVTYEGVDFTLEDLVISGDISHDGDYIGDMEATGVIDTRPLVPLVDPGGADDVLCDLLFTLGVLCITCDDGEDLCLETMLRLKQVDSVNLALTAISDPCADTQCDSECDNGVPINGCGCNASGLPVIPALLVPLLGLLRRRERV